METFPLGPIPTSPKTPPSGPVMSSLWASSSSTLKELAAPSMKEEFGKLPGVPPPFGHGQPSPGVGLGVFVGVLVGVFVGVLVGVFVGVLVGVFVGILVGVAVGVLVGVFVGVFVGVGVKATKPQSTLVSGVPWVNERQSLTPLMQLLSLVVSLPWNGSVSRNWLRD